MYLFHVLPLLILPAVAKLACNSDPDLKNGGVKISDKCSTKDGTKISGDSQLNVECDVRSRTGIFNIDLNRCIANYDFHIAAAENGGAFSETVASMCNPKKCAVSIEKGKKATLKCDADNCKGEVDLDKVITFEGTHLRCFDHVGSGASGLRKRGEISVFQRRSTKVKPLKKIHAGHLHIGQVRAEFKG